jgi:hypothetical protein
MAYTDIDKPSDYFNTVLYTGTGSTQSITGVGFQPDLVWIKRRSAIEFHVWNDAVRGVPKNIYSNSTNAEDSGSLMSAIISDGFTVQTDGSVNGSGSTYVAWNWLANGAGVSNTAGDITSTVSANTTSGFSIVSYTGNATLGATIGHGLGVAPKMVILKNRSIVEDWFVIHTSASATAGSYLKLNKTEAVASGNAIVFNNTNPTSIVFTVGNVNGTNGSGNNMIAYCFAEKKGFSKAFSYTGNGSADGVFTYCGFKPAFLLVKSTGADNWCMLDNKRDTFNVMDKRLFPHLSNAESTGVPTVVDFVSNGFKLRTSDSSFNLNGQSFIGFAIAEHPFVTSTSIPTTAR